jgi:3-oxoadipate enol-lactonase / 4-carboxymuconolactone decarboxylase
MPFVTAGGLRQYYRLDGPNDGPTIVLAHSIGCDHTMWDAQATALEARFRVLRFDARGHGATDATPGDYSIEMLARDALALADELAIERFAFCGLSLGGMIGQWLAARAPERLTAVILANTTPRVASPTMMEQRRRAVLDGGMAAVVDAVMARFFTHEGLATNIRRVFSATNPVGYAGCCAALRDLDQTALLSTIRVPALIIVGDHDVSTPWSGHGEVLASRISGARVARLSAAHLSNLEKPRSFNAALWRFLVPESVDPLRDGTTKRRAILGDAHVDRANAATTDFTRAFHKLITQYAWGTIWQRPDFDDRTRRMLALVITAALGRWEEFRMHVRAGLAHDVEACDVEEALLQVAVYAGVPAANTGFQIASEATVSGA